MQPATPPSARQDLFARILALLLKTVEEKKK